MRDDLGTTIQYLKGVGPKIAAKLEKLGIETISDLIFYWPRKYIDYTAITQIKGLSNGIFNDQFSVFNQVSSFNIQTIKGKVLGVANKVTSRRQTQITEAVVEDGTGTIKLVWFNQPFLKQSLMAGSEWIFRGKVDYNSFTNEWTMEVLARVKEPCIVPIYPTTAGLSSNYIARLVGSLIDQYCPSLSTPLEINSARTLTSRPPVATSKNILGEFLPQDIITKYELLSLTAAIRQIHQPEDFNQIEAARRRLAFDELFLISLRSRLSKAELKHEQAPVIKFDEDKVRSFVNSLPYELTGDQRKATWQIIKDLNEEKPMNRLLNGDVGSGKTAVAAIASYAVIQSGYRVALMVPTEVLASQHYQTFCGLFSSKNISVGLLTSNSKKTTATQAGPQNANIIIGTHALLQKSVDLSNPGLIIIDEQHRFGVEQRRALLALGQKPKAEGKSPKPKSFGLKPSAEMRPHFLSMTATPIPRTLHLALFGDLDVSVINDKPKNRKEIKTRFVEPYNRTKAYDFIRRQISAGRQAFVVCPLIEESEEENTDLFGLDKKSVVKESERLQKEIFPEFKVAMLHGKMKPKEKDSILSDFATKKFDILVSTSVIEVGIDIPNATVMMIEDAERFGLAQIHQFRGRVGRGEYQSFCFLFSSTRSVKSIERLDSLEKISDGFKLAEIDLLTRGPGDVLGKLQSGRVELKMASFSDKITIEQAGTAAQSVIHDGIEKHHRLRERLAEFESSKHFE
ncbi:MAG: ATP-dependent DNA helicase RecG [Patescibacteria group bacterium]